jgi:hypothetical protein
VRRCQFSRLRSGDLLIRSRRSEHILLIDVREVLRQLKLRIERLPAYVAHTGLWVASLLVLLGHVVLLHRCSVKMQADPEEDERPKQDREDRRCDGLDRCQMDEVVVRGSHHEPDHDVDDRKNGSHRAPLPHVLQDPSRWRLAQARLTK